MLCLEWGSSVSAHYLISRCVHTGSRSAALVLQQNKCAKENTRKDPRKPLFVTRLITILSQPSKGKNNFLCSIKRIKWHFVLQVALLRQEDHPMDSGPPETGRPSYGRAGSKDEENNGLDTWCPAELEDSSWLSSQALLAFSSQVEQGLDPMPPTDWPPFGYQVPSCLSTEKLFLNTASVATSPLHFLIVCLDTAAEPLALGLCCRHPGFAHEDCQHPQAPQQQGLREIFYASDRGRGCQPPPTVLLGSV